MKGFSNDSVKQFYFLAVLTTLGCILGYMLRDYISSFLGAATLYIVFRQPLLYLTERRGWRKTIAVSLLIVVSMVVVLIPIGLLSYMLSSKAQYLVEHYAEFLDIVKGWNDHLAAGYGVNLISQESISRVTTAGADFIPVLLSATLSSFTQIAVLYFLLYFMMMEGRGMERLVLQYSPFNNENTLILLKELRIQTMSNVIGIPVLIVIQAVIAWIGFWIFGMDQPFFWGVITGFASMIPIIGAAVVWISVCIYMYISGKPGSSIGAAIYNGLLLVNVEHLVRFSMLRKFGNTHPLVTFFGLVIGIELFGFLGLIFGPLLISYFMILLQIYRREYIDHLPEIILQTIPESAPETVRQEALAPEKEETI
ncbi:MAG: AI-2E family transporter [Bacteroidetes bacterium]|nr:AI-2E family transporter [Bacteroidota bacterium]